MTENQARSKGFNREVLAEGGVYSLNLLVRDDADLDGAFPAYCLLEGKMLTINGWNFTFEDLSVEA